MATGTHDWEERYRSGDTPWDSGLPSKELRLVLEEFAIPRGRAVELGCGTGTNAVYLAEQGFDVTAIDVSPLALDKARERAKHARANVNFVLADLCNVTWDGAQFDFGFDRGCYHCARKVDAPGFFRTVASLMKRGSRYLTLTGNANHPVDEGPPKLREDEIRADWEPLFRVDQCREFYLEDAGHKPGPLAWSCLMTRR